MPDEKVLHLIVFVAFVFFPYEISDKTLDYVPIFTDFL